ncbi:MAG: tripartite tricarboxylate transporter substrate binding protein [Burkholderiales bacterium]|nr:tripartite tricarboxylate transporter substrate binding protein [Burkholderiales bacterium]
MHKLTSQWIALVLAASCAFGAWGQAGKGGGEYPAKPVRIVVGFAPGGGTDIVARLFAQKFTAAWGQNVLVDNRPGAGGNIGTDIVAKSAGDGYTLLMTVPSHAINPSLYGKLPYDAVKDFAPISMVGAGPNLITAHPSLAAHSAREVVALARAKPGHLNYASTGTGTAQHLAMELFCSMAGIKIVHVPYAGGAPSTAAAMAGEVQILTSTLPSTLSYVRSGRLKALGVTGARRTQIAPDLPTIAEAAGLPGYEADVWYGLLAPAGTPQSIVRKINREIEGLMQLRDVQERLMALGFEPRRNTPEQFAQTITAEIVKWGKVVRESGARPD